MSSPFCHSFFASRLIGARCFAGYRCNVDSWTGSSGILEQTKADLVSELQNLTSTRGPYTWYRWVEDRIFWVSEHSCESETSSENNEIYESNSQYCMRQSTQFQIGNGNEHGVGSLKYLETEDRVRRFSWWTTFRVKCSHSNPDLHTCSRRELFLFPCADRRGGRPRGRAGDAALLPRWVAHADGHRLAQPRQRVQRLHGDAAAAAATTSDVATLLPASGPTLDSRRLLDTRPPHTGAVRRPRSETKRHRRLVSRSDQCRPLQPGLPLEVADDQQALRGTAAVSP